MPEADRLLLFVGASLVLLVVPGPAVIYIVTRSMDQGRAAGLASVAGITLGTLVHTAAAALGVSAILATSAVAFGVVRYAGAAYLVYLGIRRLLTKDEPLDEEDVRVRSLRRVFGQGVLVNVLNPKTALFVFAFLPQFVDPANGSVALQTLVLGSILAGLGLLSDGTYALVSSSLASWLRKSRGFLRVRRYVSGTVYVGLGVTAALTGSRSPE